MEMLGTRRGIERVVVHPGKTNDPVNPSVPATKEILTNIARGMADAGEYQVEVDYEGIKLPMRGNN